MLFLYHLLANQHRKCFYFMICGINFFLPHPNINGKGYGTVPLIVNGVHSLISVNEMGI